MPGSVPALFGRGAYSEMFLLSAFATVGAVADALGSARPRRMADLRTTLCNTQRPVCMDALVYSDPRQPGPASRAATLGIESAWRHHPHQTVTLCRQWAETAATLAGVRGESAGPAATTRSITMPPRKVVLLTRRTQSVWTNRAEAVGQLRALVHTHGGTFLDAGNAEELGVQEQRGRCYLARPQVELWRRRAFAVVSPVGAHLANVVFMQGALGGLVQSNNCGFATGTYEILAKACGVRFTTSHETQRKGVRCPVRRGFDTVKLNSPRTMQIERDDTLGAVLRSMMRGSVGVCPVGHAACKQRREARKYAGQQQFYGRWSTAQRIETLQRAGSVGSVRPANFSGSSGLKGRARFAQRAQIARRPAGKAGADAYSSSRPPASSLPTASIDSPHNRRSPQALSSHPPLTNLVGRLAALAWHYWLNWLLPSIVFFTILLGVKTVWDVYCNVPPYSSEQ